MDFSFLEQLGKNFHPMRPAAWVYVDSRIMLLCL